MSTGHAWIDVQYCRMHRYPRCRSLHFKHFILGRVFDSQASTCYCYCYIVAVQDKRMDRVHKIAIPAALTKLISRNTLHSFTVCQDAEWQFYSFW